MKAELRTLSFIIVHITRVISSPDLVNTRSSHVYIL
jgi:hypothetical protein